MKKFPLSGLKQKLICLFIILFFVSINFLNFYILPFGNGIKLSFLLLTVIVSILYAYVIFIPIVIVDANNHLVIVKIIKKYLIPLTNVTEVTIEERVVQEQTVKVIVFYDEYQNSIGVINTFYTKKQDKHIERILLACKDIIQ